MPNPCYSYPAGMPLGRAGRGAGQAARRGLREMPHSCYSYPNMCFSYPDDAPWAAPGRDAVPPALPGLRRMPQTCFSY
jgi:hypothetical protein